MIPIARAAFGHKTLPGLAVGVVQGEEPFPLLTHEQKKALDEARRAPCKPCEDTE